MTLLENLFFFSGPLFPLCWNCAIVRDKHKIDSSTPVIPVLQEQADTRLLIHCILKTFMMKNNPNSENNILKTASFPGC